MTCGGRIAKLTIDGTNQGFHETLPKYWKLQTIRTPRNFIACRKTLKERTKISLTTQMSKAFCHSKAQSK
jgi:hypothetical protein